MRLAPARIAPSTIVFTVLTIMACLGLSPAAHAQAPLAGKYECVQIEAAGRSARCQSPPLVLNRDGSYQIWGEQGTYEIVQGRWLVLSHSKRRGLGQLKSASEIVFEYRDGSSRCRVTFRRIYQAPPGVWSS
jgi:hypothetical protein